MAIQDDPILKAHQYQVDGRVADITEFVMNGGCPDYASYKKCVGMIKGIRISSELLDEAIKNHNNDEDDD